MKDCRTLIARITVCEHRLVAKEEAYLGNCNDKILLLKKTRIITFTSQLAVATFMSFAMYARLQLFLMEDRLRKRLRSMHFAGTVSGERAVTVVQIVCPLMTIACNCRGCYRSQYRIISDRVGMLAAV